MLYIPHAAPTETPTGTPDAQNRAGAALKPKPKTKLIMSRSLKSFDDVSLKVVAVRTAENSDFEFEFPAPFPTSTPSVVTPPLEQSAGIGRDIPPEIPTWHHGGL